MVTGLKFHWPCIICVHLFILLVSQAGVTHLIQHQFEELAKQNGDDNLVSGENKRRKMVIIGQDCVEPLQALRSAGREVVNLMF